MDKKDIVVRELVIAIAECIRDLKEVPSGHLYVRLMDELTLEQYELIIRILKSLQWVSESNYLLKWIGPEQPSK